MLFDAPFFPGMDSARSTPAAVFHHPSGQVFRFIKQRRLTLNPLTGSGELLMLMQAKLLFIPRQLRLQLDIFQLQGIKGGLWRGSRIHEGYVCTTPAAFALNQVMAMSFKLLPGPSGMGVQPFV